MADCWSLASAQRRAWRSNSARASWMRIGKATMTTAASVAPSTHGHNRRRAAVVFVGSASSPLSSMTSRSMPSAYVGRRFGRLGLRLLLLLVGPHFAEGIGVGDVGDGHEGPGLAEVAGRFDPPPRPHPELLAEESDEDAGLLVAEPGQGLDVAEQHFAGLGGLPHTGRIAAVLVDDVAAQLLHSFGHRARIAVERRLLRDCLAQAVGLHVGPLSG